MSRSAPEKWTRAYVALGSNLGDRLTNLRQAAGRLAAHPRVRLVAASRVIETPPMGPPQGPYLNAVLAVETTLPPESVLVLCRQIEDAGKRQRAVRWGPRTIDLDLVDVGGLVITTPTLRLPHPEMASRIFVLAPLAEVAPDWRHPETGQSVAELRAKLESSGGQSFTVVAEAESWCPRSWWMGR